MSRMNRITVDVKVGAFIKEYIISTNGSDNMVPEKDTVLWAMLKQLLVTSPNNFQPITDRKEYIRITLRPTKDAQTYSIPEEKKLAVNTLFRTHLTEIGQNTIRLHFVKQFKKSFRDYMRGAMDNNPNLKIKEAIDSFCREHKISMNNINYDTLSKDWYRTRKKGAKKLCSLIF